MNFYDVRSADSCKEKSSAFLLFFPKFCGIITVDTKTFSLSYFSFMFAPKHRLN